MKIEVNVKKGHFLIVLGVLLILTSVFGVYAVWNTSKTVYHSADDVKVTISGVNKSLQEAVTDGSLVGIAKFGGAYGVSHDNSVCYSANPVTGACNCPSGYTAVKVTGCDPTTGFVRCGFVCTKI